MKVKCMSNCLALNQIMQPLVVNEEIDENFIYDGSLEKKVKHYIEGELQTMFRILVRRIVNEMETVTPDKEFFIPYVQGDVDRVKVFTIDVYLERQHWDVAFFAEAEIEGNEIIQN